ncbi:MAG: hypothetical protein ACRC92_27405 [Peptostreptococcaceae bacterium]
MWYNIDMFLELVQNARNNTSVAIVEERTCAFHPDDFELLLALSLKFQFLSYIEDVVYESY